MDLRTLTFCWRTIGRCAQIEDGEKGTIAWWAEGKKTAMGAPSSPSTPPSHKPSRGRLVPLLRCPRPCVSHQGTTVCECKLGSPRQCSDPTLCIIPCCADACHMLDSHQHSCWRCWCRCCCSTFWIQFITHGTPNKWWRAYWKTSREESRLCCWLNLIDIHHLNTRKCFIRWSIPLQNQVLGRQLSKLLDSGFVTTINKKK